MRCEEAFHWFKPSSIIWAHSLDQVKEKEAHGNNLVQELVQCQIKQSGQS